MDDGVQQQQQPADLAFWKGRGGAKQTARRIQQAGPDRKSWKPFWCPVVLEARDVCVLLCVLCGGGFDLGLAALSTGARLPCGTEAQQCLRFWYFWARTNRVTKPPPATPAPAMQVDPTNQGVWVCGWQSCVGGESSIPVGSGIESRNPGLRKGWML